MLHTSYPRKTCIAVSANQSTVSKITFEDGLVLTYLNKIPAAAKSAIAETNNPAGIPAEPNRTIEIAIIPSPTKAGKYLFISFKLTI